MDIIDNLKTIDPTCAVSFSGHRPKRLPGRGNLSEAKTLELAISLQEQIENAIGRGRCIFINGFMAGWDILAAEQVIKLKDKYPHICLATIAPYREEFFAREKCWTEEWVKRAEEVWCVSDITVVIAERYRAKIYFERNRALVHHSSELICYCDGGRSGTKYTADYAKSKGLDVINIWLTASRE